MPYRIGMGGVVAALLVMIALPARPVLGQINIERLRRTAADSGVSGMAGLNLTARTGNVELVLLNVEGRTDVVSGRWLGFLVGNTDVGWQGGRRFSNAALLHARSNWAVRSGVILETFAQIDYDKARLLTFRALAGAGPRVNVIDTPMWRLTLGTGYMFEHEEVDLAAGAVHPRETNASRWTSYVTYRFAEGRRVTTAGTAYLQPRLGALADLRALGDFRLAVELVGAVSLVVTSRVRYDSRPPDGVDRLDAALTTGLSVEW